MAKSVNITFRITEQTQAGLIRAATEEGRSQSNYIERALIKALQQDGYVTVPPIPKVKK